MKLADVVKQAEGRIIRDENGRREALRLMPPISENELRELERTLPGPLPEEMRELLAVTRGFENGPYEVDFSCGVGEVFQALPHALSIAIDGCGNGWMVDVATDAPMWGPIYFACHDPPVFMFTASNLREFIEEWLKLAQGSESKLGPTFDRAVNRVWREDPGLISHETAIHSIDPVINAFAEKVGDSFQFVDLRRATMGDGFSWRRVNDPWTDIVRDGENLLFAIRKPQPKKPFLQRLFGR